MSDELVIVVTPGACQFLTRVTIRDHDDGVQVDLDSKCPMIMKLNALLGVVDPFEAMEMPYGQNAVYSLAGEVLSHASCPVPLAIVKAIEAKTGMAVKKDVCLEFKD